jgi:hypothetical protein
MRQNIAMKRENKNVDNIDPQESREKKLAHILMCDIYELHTKKH